MTPLALMNGLSLVRANWKAIVGAVAGAALCWPVASCHGENQADDANALRMEKAAAKARAAQAKAEAAANRAETARKLATKARQDALQGIVDHEGTNDVVGGATGAVIGKLRRDAGGADQTPKR